MSGIVTISAKEREEAFRRDLAKLLSQHGAELEVTDDGKSYGMHSGVCEISMAGKWDDGGNLVAEYTEFRL